MTHDPIADMLTRLRNAGMAKHERVEMPFSKVKERILVVLKDEGYIRDFEVIRGNPFSHIRVYMKYGPGRTSAITGINQNPGCVFTPAKKTFPGFLEVLA